MRKSGIGKRIQKYARDHKRRMTWRSLVSVMASVVVFCTTYSLILPAITLEAKTCCGLEEHTHSEEGGCYEGQPVLVCGQEESLHQHGDECYAFVVTCEKAEHTHATACFSDPAAEVQTGETAKPADHPAQAPDIQTPETAVPNPTETPLCGKQPHTHDESCLDADGNPICGLEAHVHSLSCDSDPIADLETPEIWEATLPAERTHEYRQDLLAVAKSQLGYQESAKNYAVVTDPHTGAEEKKGCTRYGYWYGQTVGADPLAYAYRDWDALFVSFCLHYAGIPEEELPRAAAAAEWVALLENGTADEMSVTAALGGGFLPAAAYTGAEIGGPWEGDLVFFDENADGTADRMGLVSGRTFAEDGYTMTGFQVIRGDAHSETLGADAVVESFCALDDPTLLGFAMLPDRQEEEPMPLAEIGADVVRAENGDLTYIPPKQAYYLRLLQNGIAGYYAGGSTSLQNIFLIYPTASNSNRLSAMPEENTAYAIVTSRNISGDTRGYLNTQTVSDVTADGSNTKGIGFAPFPPANFNEAKIWYFEKIEEGNYKIYSTTSDGAKQYLKMTKNTDRYAHLELTDVETDASCFILTRNDINFSMEVQFPSQEPERTYKVVDTVSPSNTTINVFDYWLINQDTYDGSDPKDENDSYITVTSGINKGKNLKFRQTGGSLGENPAECNKNTNPDGAYQGIVQNTLGNDGYPVLADESGQSLDYLFNPDSTQSYRQTIQNAQGLLQLDAQGYFVYNCKQNYACLQKNANGNYTNRFSVYDQWYVQHNQKDEKGNYKNQGQFYPFNPLYWESPGVNPGDPVQKQGLLVENKTWQSQMNHYFGLTLTAQFIQQNGGTTSGAPTIFEFSGDDDVWIFIDDVLVADLGGIHDVVNVTINFKDGNVVVKPVSNPPAGTTLGTDRSLATTLKQAYTNAGKDTEKQWRGNTFADSPAVHTLKFFYLERGNGASNMTLRYNLVNQNTSEIYKVDQDGNPVEGAKFAVYTATKTTNPDGTYTYTRAPDASPVYTGVTNEYGSMSFMDKTTGASYSMAEMRQKFGEYVILEETEVPPGYRTVSSNGAWLHLDPESDCIFCENVYQSGVWAKNKALVSIPQKDPLKVASGYGTTAGSMASASGSFVTGGGTTGYKIGYVNSNGTDPNGTLFAVALKRNGSTEGIDAWTPIYGSDASGYHSVPVTSGNLNVTEAIFAAKEQENLTGSGSTVFTLSVAEPQLLMKNLPGKVSSYQGVGTGTDKEYAVAFFWTSGTLANADSTNTLRVEPGENIKTTWGTTVEVPNMENRLFVQKLDPKGTLVNGATFALYPALDAPSENAPGTNYVYYKCTEPYYYAALTSASGNTGDAVVFNVPAEGSASKIGSGTYSIDPATGKITVTVTKDGSQTFYSVEPATNVRGEPLIGATHNVCDFISEAGTAHFSKLTDGKYYLREIAAPPGYRLNPTDIPVLVNKNGVFAYAGDANDDITVGNGAGYVTKTLNMFAPPGGIDETLAWVKGKLFTNATTGFGAFGNVSGSGSSSWTAGDEIQLVYSGALTGNTNTVFDYTWFDTSMTTPPILTTDTGWSYMEIYQENRHKSTSSSNYDVLNGNIANLFSSSTFVRVTDPPEVTMTKKVKEGETWGAANDASTGDTVDFQITISAKPGVASCELDDSLDSEGALAYILEKETDSNHLKGWSGTIGTAGRTFAVEYKAPVTGGPTGCNLTENKADGTEVAIGTMTVKDGQRGFTVTFTREFLDTITEDTDIIFHYTARLTDKADDTVPGFKNTASLTYSFSQRAYTLASETVTSTWKLPIYKYTGSGETKTPLANAEFTLKDANGTAVKLEKSGTDYAVNPNGTEEKVVSGANGKIEIRGLDSGSYTLTETKPPDGYRPLTEPITIDIGKDGTITATNVTPQGEVEIQNDPGYELPETGGTGTALFTICGLLIMAAAAGCGYGLRRGQERRARLKGISE